MVSAGVSCVFDETIMLDFLLVDHVAERAARSLGSGVQLLTLALSKLDLRVRSLLVFRFAERPIEV